MPLTMDMSQKQLKEQLLVIKKVANFHEFELLSSVVGELMTQF
jgi:hypothetical protein